MYFNTPWQFIGETLISGGFLGILITFIVDEHGSFVMREKNLGLKDDQTTLFDALFKEISCRGINSKYVYKQRDYMWELVLVKDNPKKWAVKLNDTSSIYVKDEKIESLPFVREADVSMTDKPESVELFDVTLDEVVDYLTPQLIPYLTVSNKRYFNLIFSFKPNREYRLSLPYEYPPSMCKNNDYIHMMNPVLTYRSIITLKLPVDFDYDRYNFNCYVINNRYEQAFLWP